MTRREWVAVMIAIATKIWLASARSLEAIGWAVHDDRWFLTRARSILGGEWLGAYDHMTLIKGPAYPLFIALVSSLHVPLLLAQQVLYAIACVVVCIAVGPWVRAPAARVMLFVVLLFNPMSFADEISTRVLREGFYPALALFVFAGIAGTVLECGDRSRRFPMRQPQLPRLRSRHRKAATAVAALHTWAVLCGLALAAFWLTREEGVWILPLVVLGAIAARDWRSIAVAALIFIAVYVAVIVANGMRYGVYEVVEFKERSFVRAYGTLTRVRQHPPEPRIPVSREVRERVYAVSPAFAELRAFFEGPAGAAWVRASQPQGRGDIGGAWFMWAFREAVADAGYYTKGSATVRAYYSRLTHEIDVARREGRLDAEPGRATLLPPLRPGQRAAVLKTWLRGLWRLVTFADFSATPRYSQGIEDELREFAETTHARLAPRRRIVLRSHLIGWVVHVDGALDLAVEHSDGRTVEGAQITRLPSPDLYEHLKARWKAFEPARHARFDIRVPLGDAFLVLTLRGKRIERIPITEEPLVSFDPNVRMSIEKADVETVAPKLGAHDAFRLRVMNWIGRGYQIGFPIAFVAAIVVGLRARRSTAASMLLLGVLGAIAARVLILALIDVTSFWVLIGVYQSPSYPLLLLAAGLLLSPFEPGPL